MNQRLFHEEGDWVVKTVWSLLVTETGSSLVLMTL
jgi:hypothetical protein